MCADRIERELLIEAPVDRVWEALTQPESVSSWFCDGAPVTLDLREGGVMVLDHGQHGVFPTVIVTVDPPHVFSYRWASAFPGVLATPENSTLVEFTLRPSPEGCVLRLVESGFDKLDMPAERVAAAGIESHTEGWAHMVKKLAEFASTSGGVEQGASS